MTAWLIILGLIGTGILLERNGTLRRKGWRIYFDRLSFPHCKTHPPLIRMPQSFQAYMWGGGWTCRACGAKVDNWGHLLTPPASTENKGSCSR
jgi:hypothetical protein